MTSAPERKAIITLIQQANGPCKVWCWDITYCLLREQCLHQPLVLHADNGAPMKAQTMKAKLEELGVLPSYSRPPGQ